MVNILWVEDDYEIISDLPHLLTDQGYKIDLVNSKKEFLEISDNLNKYQVAIVDLIIPQLIEEEEYINYPGLDVIKILREKMGSKIKIIIFSVVQNPNAINHELDVDLILYKGYLLPEEFAQSVKELINEPTD